MFLFSDVLVASRLVTAQGVVRRRIGSRTRRVVLQLLEEYEFNGISLAIELPSTFLSIHFYGSSCSNKHKEESKCSVQNVDERSYYF
jgi:hypothetical protein